MMPKRSASSPVRLRIAARCGTRLFHGVAERSEIFFGDVRAGAVEQGVAIGTHRGDLNAVVSENFVEVAGATAM